MNKSLDICKASLVSLKAELLRKQDEANKAKSFSGDTFIRPIPGAKTPSCLLQSNEGVEKRNAKDLEEEYTPDVENSLKKSRDVLTMKAKLYDKLVNGEMVSEQDKTFLVDFKQKVTEHKTTYPVSSTKDNVKEQEKSDSDADLDKYDSGADDDWIDYTDFFGRTRRCLKTDLEFFKNRDQRIEKELEPPPPSPNTIKQQTSITAQQFVKEGRNPEEISELVSSDMRREQLRLKWEEEERKLAERTDIHYEDIRFDVSLKAELLRKQDEANKAKSFSGDTFIRPIPGAKTPSCLLQSNEGVEKRNAKDLEEEYTPDVENSLKKSRDVLTMKAKLYDKLVNGEMVSEQDKTFLVDFKQKVTEHKTTYPVSSTKDNVKEQEKSDSDADLDKYDSGADDDWIDYTDFFGRTRRCLKTDLEFFKNRDQRIEKELEPPPPSPNTIKQQTSITAQQFVKEGRNPEEISELVSSDMRREQLRLKWEEEERKLAERTDIHYEDIRFDEVREHGVGYYSFSTDEKERHRQQAELKKLREQTKTTQISVQKLKEKRAAQMAIRLKAIKRRKKEKLGLPIDSSSDEEAPPPKAPSPEVVEEDMDAERAFEKLRKAAHVRPWDHGKDGLQKPLLTQEEWNEKQRAERKPDFAWDYNEGPKVPKSVSSNNYRPDDNEDDDDDDDDDEDMVGPSLDMFVAPSNPNKQSTITSKSFKKFIHNELDDEPATTQNKPYQDDDLDSIPLPTEQRTGAEIAPPPTYEYYGPSGRGPKAQDNFISTNEMQDSISKGFTSAKSMNKHRPVRGIVDDDDDE